MTGTTTSLHPFLSVKIRKFFKNQSTNVHKIISSKIFPAEKDITINVEVISHWMVIFIYKYITIYSMKGRDQPLADALKASV